MLAFQQIHQVAHYWVTNSNQARRTEEERCHHSMPHHPEHLRASRYSLPRKPISYPAFQVRMTKNFTANTALEVWPLLTRPVAQNLRIVSFKEMQSLWSYHYSPTRLFFVCGILLCFALVLLVSLVVIPFSILISHADIEFPKSNYHCIWLNFMYRNRCDLD